MQVNRPRRHRIPSKKRLGRGTPPADKGVKTVLGRRRHERRLRYEKVNGTGWRGPAEKRLPIPD